MYGGAGCDFHEESERYPANEDKDYFGRGPLFIEGNDEYGAFGDAFGPIKYDGFGAMDHLFFFCVQESPQMNESIFLM